MNYRLVIPFISFVAQKLAAGILPYSDRPTFVLSFDLDYDEDYGNLPWLLKRLARFKIPASFACIGKFVEKYPHLHRDILGQNHEIMNHTYSHPHNFDGIGETERKDQILKCDRVISKVLSYKTVGFRSPHFRNPIDLYQILKDIGYLYSSSQLQYKVGAFGKTISNNGIVEFPLSSRVDNPRQTIESYSLFRSKSKLPSFKAEMELLRHLTELLKQTAKTNSFSTIFLDPMDIGGAPKFNLVLERIYEFKRRERGLVACYRDLIKQ